MVSLRRLRLGRIAWVVWAIGNSVVLPLMSLLALEYDEGITTVWLPLLVPLLMRVRVLDEADLSSHVSGARQEKMGDAMDVPAQ